jgi:hypothetical protein
MATVTGSTPRESSTAMADPGRVLCEHRNTAEAAGSVLIEHPTTRFDLEDEEDV